jgi:hypothetical protein
MRVVGGATSISKIDQHFSIFVVHAEIEDFFEFLEPYLA